MIPPGLCGSLSAKVHGLQHTPLQSLLHSSPGREGAQVPTVLVTLPLETKT